MNYIIILIFLIVVGLVISVTNYNSNNTERFDETGSVFMPIGYNKYGLRGERINTRPINDCYWDHYKCYTSTHHPYFPSYDMTPRMMPEN